MCVSFAGPHNNIATNKPKTLDSLPCVQDSSIALRFIRSIFSTSKYCVLQLALDAVPTDYVRFCFPTYAVYLRPLLRKTTECTLKVLYYCCMPCWFCFDLTSVTSSASTGNDDPAPYATLLVRLAWAFLSWCLHATPCTFPPVLVLPSGSSPKILRII